MKFLLFLDHPLCRQYELESDNAPSSILSPQSAYAKVIGLFLLWLILIASLCVSVCFHRGEFYCILISISRRAIVCPSHAPYISINPISPEVFRSFSHIWLVQYSTSEPALSRLIAAVITHSVVWRTSSVPVDTLILWSEAFSLSCFLESRWMVLRWKVVNFFNLLHEVIISNDFLLEIFGGGAVILMACSLVCVYLSCWLSASLTLPFCQCYHRCLV